MTEQLPPKPPLQKPPGYRDPSLPGKPVPRPPPARKPAFPPSFRQPRKQRRRRTWCRACCCFAAVFSLILALAAATAAGIFYLWFDPKLPVFHLQSVRVPRLNVTVRPDGTYLDASAVARIEARNPNARLEIYYAATRVDIGVGGGGGGGGGDEDDAAGLGSGGAAGFVQRRGNTTSLKVETAVKGQLVEDGLGRRLRSRYRSKGLVVEVRAWSRIGYVVRGVRVGAVGVAVRCGGVSLKRLSAGDMPKCTIQMLKWIKIN